MENENMEQSGAISSVEALLDPNNNEPITLYDADGNGDVFDQVAITNVNGALYTILKPQLPFEGMGDDEALVFAFEENDEGDVSLVLVTDLDVVDAVFADYYEMLRENGIEV